MDCRRRSFCETVWGFWKTDFWRSICKSWNKEVQVLRARTQVCDIFRTQNGLDLGRPSSARSACLFPGDTVAEESHKQRDSRESYLSFLSCFRDQKTKHFYCWGLVALIYSDHCFSFSQCKLLGELHLKTNVHFEYIQNMYIYIYIADMLFLNTGKTISNDQKGSHTSLVYNYLKCFCPLPPPPPTHHLFILSRERRRVHGRGCSVSQPYLF